MTKNILKSQKIYQKITPKPEKLPKTYNWWKIKENLYNLEFCNQQFTFGVYIFKGIAYNTRKERWHIKIQALLVTFA
jgi:hypothetical protein